MRANFKLIARGLVHVRRTQNVESFNFRRQRNRAFDDRTSALCRFDDFGGGLVDQAIVKCLQANANFLFGLRLMDIIDPTDKTVDALMKLDLPAGVDVEIKL